MSAQLDVRPRQVRHLRRDRTAWWTDRERALAGLPAAVLAVATLWWPDHGDQALFRLTAAQMNHGAVYYRDFWDIKQPGIYWFYQFGDLLIPGGLGARLLEIALALVSAVLVTRVTDRWHLRRSVRLAAPTMVLGPYLIWSFLDGVGQIEGLMNVLLLTVLAASWPGPEGRVRPGWAWFVAGLAIGAVVLLKTLYGPIPLVLLAVAAWRTWRIDRRATVFGAGWAVLGGLLPVIAALVYFVDHGVLDLALRTTFQLPSQVAAIPDTHNASSRPELEQSLKNMFPVIGPLAVVGLVSARRQGQLAIAGALAATAAMAFALSLPQLFTPYRWLMLAAPVGLLAVLGLESVLAWLPAHRGTPGSWPSRRTLALRALAALFVIGLTAPMLRQPATRLLHANRYPWGLGQTARIERGPSGPSLTTAADDVADQMTPGEQIYVLGDPGLIALLHARQGAEIAGWSMPMMPPSVWDELTRELERSRPRLIFVDDRDWSTPRAGAGKQLFAFLDQHYRVLTSTPGGTWYQTSQPGQPLPEPGGNQLFAHD